MKISIESQNKNQLLGREEAWLVAHHEGKATPNRAELIEAAAKALNAEKTHTIIEDISGSEGRSVSRFRVYVYSKKEAIPTAKLEKMNRRMGFAKKEGEAAPAA